jgi:hypothetical protein
LLGFHELQVHGLHCREILVENLRQRAAALGHVATDPSNQTDVRVRVHEHFHVAQVAHTGIDEEQDPIDDDDVGGRDLHDGLAANVSMKIVYRLLDRAPLGRSASCRTRRSQSNAFGWSQFTVLRCSNGRCEWSR